MLSYSISLLHHVLANSDLPIPTAPMVEALSHADANPDELAAELDRLAKDERITVSVDESGSESISRVDVADPHADIPVEEGIRNASREALYLLLTTSRYPRYDVWRIPDDMRRRLPGMREELSHEIVLGELLRTGACCMAFVNHDESAPLQRLELQVRTNEAIAEVLDTVAKEQAPENRRILLEALCSQFEIADGDPLHAALQACDRAEFMPDRWKSLAYYDQPVPIVEGSENQETMTESAPHALIYTIQAVAPKPGDRVLICGVKGGSLAALIAHMVGEKGLVRCLDWRVEVADRARIALERIRAGTAMIAVTVQEDVTVGVPAEHAWHMIIMNGSLPKVPYEPIEQLDQDEGRILFFMSTPDGSGSNVCYVIRKNRNIIKHEELSRFRYTPIPGKYGWDSMGDLERQYSKAQATKEGEAASLQKRHAMQHSPYPLARMLQTINKTYNPVERHRTILRAYEVLIKYYAIPCIIVCEQAGRADDQYREALSKLPRPTLGQWIAVLRAGIRLCRGAHPVDLIASDMEQQLTDRAVLTACSALTRATIKEEWNKQKVSLMQVLDIVVKYRNSIEHSAPLNVSDQERLCEHLVNAYMAILHRTSFVNACTLMAIGDIRVDKENEEGFRAEAYELRGGDYDLKRNFPLPERLKPDSVYLFSGGRAVCKLTPWLVFDEGDRKERDLFIYNSDGRFLTYHNSDSYPPTTEAEEIRKLLEINRPSSPLAADPTKAMQFFSEVLDDYAEDGVIEAREMEKLIARALKYGLAESEAEARAFIRKQTAERYPAVVVEE